MEPFPVIAVVDIHLLKLEQIGGLQEFRPKGYGTRVV
jgi:hypothetical protein